MSVKNLVGDVFVAGHPLYFDNYKLYEEYKEREKAGFPCKYYISAFGKNNEVINLEG